MEQIVTQDGSVSFRSLKYGEPYHTESGAIEEGFKKFAEPCKLKDGDRVLDVCFGIGYNSLAALSLADVTIVGLENDPLILQKVFDVEVSSELKEKYSEIRRGVNGESSKVKIIVGDAREMIDKVGDGFDAVFLDPFSPPKCPELWTEEFFKQIYDVMVKGGRLATYSCARVVRENLIKVGFKVIDGPVVGRRSPSTIGVKE